jgi:hypothetical protein
MAQSARDAAQALIYRACAIEAPILSIDAW